MYVLIMLMIVGIGMFCYYQNNGLIITKIKINCNIKGKVKIVQLSDLHSKEFGENNYNLFKKVIEQDPDILFATGDIIDSNSKNIDSIIKLLSDINKIVPVFYIPGNNEVRIEKLEEILNKLKDEKINVLNNEIISINVKQNRINILGLVEGKNFKEKFLVNKAKGTYSYEGDKELFNRLEKKSGLKLVLSHYPENFEAAGDKSYSKYNFDIMFSGHAHGGQFILPGIGGLFAPGQGIRPKYYGGLYGNKNKLVVSRGLGNSGFPLRLFNRPDIVVVDIEQKN